MPNIFELWPGARYYFVLFTGTKQLIFHKTLYEIVSIVIQLVEMQKLSDSEGK